MNKLVLSVVLVGTLVLSGTVPEKPIKTKVTKNNITYIVYKAL